MPQNDLTTQDYIEQMTDGAWKARWKVDKPIPGGAQAEAFRVKHKFLKTSAFLKVMKKTTDLERRARFFRESAAYKSYQHKGLLPLIQTNAHLFEDLEIAPYIITEWVDGRNLRSRLEESGILDLNDALTATVTLLDIIAYLHSEGCVHRDVKPDNIILRGDQPSDPVLLDFGICYSANPDMHRTEAGQELGNRFLRLLELSSGSNGKQDPISDITFVAGILFFMLSGHSPSTLRDGEGKHPHQIFSINPEGKISSKQEFQLKRFFDRAFRYEVSRRFQTASEMKVELKLIAMTTENNDDDDDSILEDLSKQLSEQSTSQEIELLLRCKRLIHRVQQIAEDTIGPLNSRGVLVRTQADGSDFQVGSKIKFGFGMRLDDSRKYIPQIEAVNIGHEIVLYLDGETIGRFVDDEPLLDDEQHSKVKRIYTRGVQKLFQ